MNHKYNLLRSILENFSAGISGAYESLPTGRSFDDSSNNKSYKQLPTKGRRLKMMGILGADDTKKKSKKERSLEDTGTSKWL